jgi:NADH-quinone oxidoreductase subunit A
MQYLPIIIFIAIAIALSLLIIVIPFIINKSRPNKDKNSPYECGFEGVGLIRNRFEVQFYLVAILFIIFDLEAVYFFPWCMSLSFLSADSFWGMIDFIFELGIGLIYAWEVCALDN